MVLHVVSHMTPEVPASRRSAAWVALCDFAGCEEHGRGDRAALSELAKRASSTPCRDCATSACTRMSTERTQAADLRLAGTSGVMWDGCDLGRYV